MPKQVLQDLCIDADLPSEGAVADLATSLWGKLQQNNGGRRRYLENALPYIYGGRTSVFWLVFDPASGSIASQEELIQRFGFDPFGETRTPGPDAVDTRPKLIGACELEDGRRLARFVVKTRVGRRISGYYISEDATLTLLTVLIDSEQGIVEIRGGRTVSKAVVQAVQDLLCEDLRLRRWDVTGAFDHSIEGLADSLDGKLMEAVSKPEALVENLTQDQLRSVIDIIQCVGQFLQAGDVTFLEQTLTTARETLAAADADFTGMPFMAVVLAGMKGLNLSAVDQDLRMQPLYSLLGPVLQHQGGYIVFPVQEEGDTEYTIRVGIKSNTIAFCSLATEMAIDKVRAAVLGG